MSGVRRWKSTSKGALALTEPRQLMIGCGHCGSTLASRALPSFARHPITMAARKTAAAKGGSHGI
jgi:hypothetical protein